MQWTLKGSAVINDSYGFQKPATDSAEQRPTDNPKTPNVTPETTTRGRTDGLWEHQQGHVKLNPKEVAPTIPPKGWRLVATAPPGHEFYHDRKEKLCTRVAPART